MSDTAWSGRILLDEAPPGPYLLFVLDSERVPSVGWPVDLVVSPTPAPISWARRAGP